MTWTASEVSRWRWRSTAPAGEWSSIAVASVRDDGLYHVAVLDHREGTGWLAEEVHRLYVAHHPNVIMCDPRSPAAMLYRN